MTIPASRIVQINPDVVGTGGNPLSLNGVVISKNAAIPNGTILSFSSADSVGSYFGTSSDQKHIADLYFKGFDGATKLPNKLFFSHFASVDHPAYVFGGSLATMTLAELQALSGVLVVTIGGVIKTSSTINLSAVSSFSAAATAITAAFTSPAFAVTWNAQRSQFIIAGTVAGVASTVIYPTGSIAAGLKFTQATGAILAQGIDAETEADAMNRVKNATQNWASFTTDYEPLKASKLLFGAWANTTGQRYLYVCYDSDVNAQVSGDTTTAGYYFKANKYDGVICISGQTSTASAASTTVYQQAQDVAAFLMGAIASVDFDATNGRVTFAFKSQAGLSANVDDDQISLNLIENGYNFYGSYATANDSFLFFYNGNIAGRWVWLDPYINQIFMNNQFQLANMVLLTSVNAIDYGVDGRTQIRQSASPVISQAINNGTIRQGIALDASQIVQVNSQAGLKIDTFLSTDGYYLQIKAPTAQNRGLRKTPIMNFWYTDGGAVQQITMASIDVM